MVNPHLDVSRDTPQIETRREEAPQSYGMDTNRPMMGFDVTKANWSRNRPLNIDYNQLESDTLANRQRVGWVPKGGRYIPASMANLQGYFDDPNAPGKSYFETNPEFKTFFPNDPYYAGLASLKEWQRSGKGIYDETYTMGPGYWGSYNVPSKQISINLGEDADEELRSYYGAYPDNTRAYRDTLLHEMMHHWSYQPDASGETPKDKFKSLRGAGHSDVITEGESMWNPLGDFSGTLYDMDEAQDFMKMHRLGKRDYQGNNFNTGGLASLMV